MHMETSSDYSDDDMPQSVNPIERYRSTRKAGFSSYGSSFGSKSGSTYGSKPATVRTEAAPASSSANDTGDIHTPDEVKVGTRIVHAKLGKGVISKIDFVMGEGVITVQFTNAGEKKLYLRFAKFNIEQK